MTAHTRAATQVPRVELGQTNIIFDIPHPSYFFTSMTHLPQHSTSFNTRNQERHYPQKDESAPLCRPSNSYPISLNNSISQPIYVDSTIQRLLQICNTLESSNTPRPLRLCYNFKKSTSSDVTLQDKNYNPPVHTLPPT